MLVGCTVIGNPKGKWWRKGEVKRAFASLVSQL